MTQRNNLHQDSTNHKLGLCLVFIVAENYCIFRWVTVYTLMTESPQERAKKHRRCVCFSKRQPSSPVCRINKKLANTPFASSFFAPKSGLSLILTLIDAYGSAKPIPALFAGCIMIPLADLLCFEAIFLPK